MTKEQKNHLAVKLQAFWLLAFFSLYAPALLPGSLFPFRWGVFAVALAIFAIFARLVRKGWRDRREVRLFPLACACFSLSMALSELCFLPHNFFCAVAALAFCLILSFFGIHTGLKLPLVISFIVFLPISFKCLVPTTTAAVIAAVFYFVLLRFHRYCLARMRRTNVPPDLHSVARGCVESLGAFRRGFFVLRSRRAMIEANRDVTVAIIVVVLFALLAATIWVVSGTSLP